MDIPEPLQQALGESITSGRFIDTKLWTFSSRNKATGRVGKPQPIYVSGRVLGSLPQFQHVLSEGNYVENIREGFPDLPESLSENYDYSSDSDFELDDEEVGPSKEEPQGAEETARSEDGATVALDDEKCGDILHVEKEDIRSETSGAVSVSEMESALAEFEDINTNPRRFPKTVVISDVAFVTLRAAVRYLYTNDIEFASPRGPKSREDEEDGRRPSQLPRPSARSVYRLAVKYEIQNLKLLALDEIKRTLDSYDIIEELFSKYTSCFPEIREVQAEHLARNLLSSIEPWKAAALKRKIEVYTSGALPHAQDVLPTLYHRLANPLRLSMRTPHPFQLPQRGDFNWGALKNELMKSMSSGTFLNMELYASESKSPAGQQNLRPLYFCSAIGGEYTTKMLSCVKDPSSGYHDTSGNSYKCDSDIEIEDDETPESTVSLDRNKRMQTRSFRESSTTSFGVLSTGAWKTWRAILYYLYTNRISFRKLSSQPPVSTEVGTSVAVGFRQAESLQLSPCSPKSVYNLACTIGLQSLRSIAFEDFKSKIDSTNITQELLSPFSARHVTIRTMLLRFFEIGMKSPGNEELFITSMRTSADGQTPHRSAAIGLVFERLIEDGRKVLSPSIKPKPSSTFDSVTLAATITTTTRSPPNTGSTHAGGGGVEVGGPSWAEEFGKSKKSGKKKNKLERPHSPPCGCPICKRTSKSSKKSLSLSLS